MLSSVGDSPFSFQGLSVAGRFLVRQASGAGVDVGSFILACGRTTSDATEMNCVLRRTFSWLSHLYTYLTEGSMWCEELAVNWCFITKCVWISVYTNGLYDFYCLLTLKCRYQFYAVRAARMFTSQWLWTKKNGLQHFSVMIQVVKVCFGDLVN